MEIEFPLILTSPARSMKTRTIKIGYMPSRSTTKTPLLRIGGNWLIDEAGLNVGDYVTLKVFIRRIENEITERKQM